MEVKFVTTLRKRVLKGGKVAYYMTVPKSFVEAYELDKYIGEKFEVLIKKK